MAYHAKLQIPYAPTETTDLYPESDGKPMAETDLHIHWIIWMREALKAHFAQMPDVYLSGNIMMYDVEGPHRKSVSPDILVTFGIGRKFRRTYKVWEEGKPPDFVMEFSSKSTFRNDLDGKMALYAAMGIAEYFLYDADRRYLSVPLMGFRLVDGAYVEISPDAEGGISSAVLGLDFHLLDDGLRLYAPGVGQWLQTPAERAERETEARLKAEAEVARLRAELARLKERL